MSEDRLGEIATRLLLLASELRGYEDVPQWLQIERCAVDLENERRLILKHVNALAARLVAAEREVSREAHRHPRGAA